LTKYIADNIYNNNFIMTVQEETETASAAATMLPPPQKEENDAQVDVEIGIDGDDAEVMGTKEETATDTSTAEPERTPSRRTKWSKKSLNRHASSDDPFAVREGKTLLWTDVNMVLVSQSLPSTGYIHMLLELVS
jgi:hypothetical protein